MGLSTRLIRVSREDMKCVIFAAVFVACVIADGSMPTVAEVQTIPETEFAAENAVESMLKDTDKTRMFSHTTKEANDLTSAVDDRVDSTTDQSSAKVTEAYDNA